MCACVCVCACVCMCIAPVCNRVDWLGSPWLQVECVPTSSCRVSNSTGARAGPAAEGASTSDHLTGQSTETGEEAHLCDQGKWWLPMRGRPQQHPTPLFIVLILCVCLPPPPPGEGWMRECAQLLQVGQRSGQSHTRVVD